jgi:type VI secretion system protein ImpH
MTTDALALQENFGRYDLLQLVRVMSRPIKAGAAPRRPDEVVKFRADLGAEFPGRNATALEPAVHEGGPMRLTTPDFCVGSVIGPLPEAFLEWVRDLDRLGNRAMRNFLDLFNHRFNVLRYDARAAFEPGLDNQPPARTLRAMWLAALIGIGNESLASQIPLAERNWLGIGELLANNRHTVPSVERVLAAYLDCPVRLEPLVPEWRPLGHTNEHALGTRRLGEDTLLGRSLWDVQSAVRLHIGPMDYERMIGLLPSQAPAQVPTTAPSARNLQRKWRDRQLGFIKGESSAHVPPSEALVALVHLMLDRRHNAILHIHVREATIPASVLDSHPPHGNAGLRLGQTAWLKQHAGGDASAFRSVRIEVPSHPEPP